MCRLSLQESGWLSMGDLASRFKLPVEYVSSIILPQVGSAVPGRLYGQLIFTDAFISRIRAQVPFLTLFPSICCTSGTSGSLWQSRTRSRPCMQTP